MISIRFYQKKDKGSVHMTLRGHAGAAAKGEDLVCASATMLAYTAAQAMRFLYEQDKLKCRPRLRIREGEAVIIATPKPDALAEVLMAFWVVQAGVYVLSRNYPQYVTLEPLQV